LLDDDSVQSPLACSLFKQLEDGAISAVLEDIVLAEAVWVLEKGYRVPRNEISLLLSSIVSLKGIECRGKRNVLEALSRFCSTSCDIVDCLLAAKTRGNGTSVISFDADFKKLRCEWMPPS
jgi:predicted nucleic-acid-binding protein